MAAASSLPCSRHASDFRGLEILSNIGVGIPSKIPANFHRLRADGFPLDSGLTTWSYVTGTQGPLAVVELPSQKRGTFFHCCKSESHDVGASITIHAMVPYSCHSRKIILFRHTSTMMLEALIGKIESDICFFAHTHHPSNPFCHSGPCLWATMQVNSAPALLKQPKRPPAQARAAVSAWCGTLECPGTRTCEFS